jgi:HlyD family secretion protein
VAGQIVSLGDDPRGTTDPRYKGKPVDFDTLVEEGTILARIDDAIYKARVDQEKAACERAKAELTAATAEPRQPHVAVAHAAIAQSEAALKVAQISLDNTVIKSPIKGVILARRVNVGQNVGPDPKAASLFLIAKYPTKLQVWASVNEADIGRIHEGMEARFTVDAFPKETFKGKVAQMRLNAQMVQNVVLYTVVVTCDNADMKLRPYLTANLQFETASTRNVLRVPGEALRWKPQPDQVAPDAHGQVPAANDRASRVPRLWAKDKDGEHVRPVEVQVGLSDGKLTEVSGPDVKEGMEVVIGEGPGAKLPRPAAQTPKTPTAEAARY